MSVFFIHNKETAERDFDEVAPLLQKCIDHAVHGEFDVPSLRRLAEEGSIVIIGWREEGKRAHFAIAVEWIFYPNGRLAANVMACGGSRLGEAHDKVVLPGLIRFLKAAGAEELECSVSPAMERLLHRYSTEWKETYRCLRLKL